MRICFTSNEIATHPCAKCQPPMLLTRAYTDRLAYDVHTVECFNCDNVDKVMTEAKRGSAAFPFPRR